MKRYTKMYENKYKNIATSGKNELAIFLNLLADLDVDIELFADTSLISDYKLKFKQIEDKL